MKSRLFSRRILWAVALALGIALLSSACGKGPISASPVVRIGAVPKESPEKTQAYLQPFQKYLEEKTGLQIELVVPTDYTAVVEAMAAGRIDVAYFGALSYVQASKKVRLHPFAKAIIAGSDTYHSVIITLKDSPITTLTDLKGRTFAFGDISSTSGHLIPTQALLEAGIDPQKDFEGPPLYTGAHNATVLAVYNGKVEAGAVEEPVLQEMIRQGLVAEDRLKIIWRSDPIPQYPWVIRDDIPQEIEDKLVQAFLEAPSDVLPPTVAEGFVRASAADYEEIRQIAERLGLAGGGTE